MYKYKFHPEAQKELAKLNHSVQILFTKILKKILNSPGIGQDLGNKNNLDLTGLKKMYLDQSVIELYMKLLKRK